MVELRLRVGELLAQHRDLGRVGLGRDRRRRRLAFGRHQLVARDLLAELALDRVHLFGRGVDVGIVARGVAHELGLPCVERVHAVLELLVFLGARGQELIRHVDVAVELLLLGGELGRALTQRFRLLLLRRDVVAHLLGRGGFP